MAGTGVDIASVSSSVREVLREATSNWGDRPLCPTPDETNLRGPKASFVPLKVSACPAKHTIPLLHGSLPLLESVDTTQWTTDDTRFNIE